MNPFIVVAVSVVVAMLVSTFVCGLWYLAYRAGYQQGKDDGMFEAFEQVYRDMFNAKKEPTNPKNLPPM